MINLKSNKGVTMVALGVTILIIVIITSTLVYNSFTGMSTRTLNNMYNDVELLENKIAAYYVKYGQLPILNLLYTDISTIKDINVNDNGNYYVIDLSLLPNLTLNFGKGYKSIKQGDTSNNDVYVINEQSHNVYYPAGVKYDGIMYYTVQANYSNTEVNGL